MFGDFDSAVKRQKKAIDLLTGEEEQLRADFEERLKLYQSGKRSSKDAETTAQIEGAVKWLGREHYYRAKTKMSGGEFAEAISDYEAAPKANLKVKLIYWKRH